MPNHLTRRAFPAALGAGLIVGAELASGAQPPKPMTDPTKTPEPPKPAPAAGPVEAELKRDYEAPKFKPGWKKPQINRTLIQDFVIYAHSDLPMTQKLLAKEPMLINAVMDWGGGDWESALGGAGHMGRRDIVDFLLENGARVDHFAAAMLGQLEVLKSLLTLQKKLIDSRGPHGFTLHFYAQAGGKAAEPVLEYLQTVKKIDLKPFPFKLPEPPKKA